MAKKPGLLDSLKKAVMEDDSPDVAEEARAPAATPAAASFGFGLGSPGATTTYVPTIPQQGASSPQSATLDPAAVQEMEKRVYVDFGGRASKFLKFVQMWHKLGQPRDPSTVISALQVFDASFTAPAILEDLEGHFKLLDNAAAGAKAEVEQASREMVGGAEDEITKLQQECAAAEDEVKRINEAQRGRIERITTLTREREENKGKIDRAYQKTAGAADKVRADLASLQQLLSTAR